MLTTLRSAAGTWVAKLLLMMLVLSFAVWGISGSVNDQMGGKVITAGKTSVSVMEYRLAYDRQLSILSQQFGQRISRDQARAFGIDNQVLGQLVAGAVLDEQARKLGLGLSKDRIAHLTRQDPAFQGPDGQFNRQQFDYVLQQVGMRPDDYFDNRAQVAVRQQIVEAVSDGMQAPDAFLRAVALYRGEDRTADYIVLPRSLVEPIDEPSNEVLTKYFEDNLKTYSAPEYRKFAYVKLEPEDAAQPNAVTDQEIQENYDANKARFTTPETRTIQQLVFASEDAANAALASIKSGATFDQVMTGEGKTEADVSLGTVSKDKVADSAIADAAFALSANEVSQVVKGSFGPVLLRVTAITPEVVKPLAEVSNEIRQQIAISEASRNLVQVHDAYEDARANGETMQEAAGKLDLEIVTVEAMDRAGQRPDGSVVNDLPQSRELVQAVFEGDQGMENPPVNIGASGYVFYEIEDVVAPRDRTLDEVRDRVVTDWKNAEAESRLLAKATELEKRVTDGTSLDDIATELSLEKQTKRGLRRQADDGDIGRDGVTAAFAVKEGGVDVISAPTGNAKILFKVTEVFEPAGADANSVAETDRNNFASGMSDDVLDQLVARLQSQYEVQTNRTAIDQALSF
ncbi:SurA N-terminal domain-containing protein [Mesorhizobium sp. SB112]|uniref:SurA N-terminal domain-containing protein n=1 Tax=Mesorhizobium sp. SB112 TaxID=3151853 RepID=UPI003266E0A6